MLVAEMLIPSLLSPTRPRLRTPPCEASQQQSRFLDEISTPALLVDVDLLAQRGVELPTLVRAADDDDFTLAAAASGAVYVHSSVISRAPPVPYHKDAQYTICELDCKLPPTGLTLCMGLNNHYDASYYWARSAGLGAALPAPGIGVRRAAAPSDRAEVVRLPESTLAASGIQTNDGKRSEWCEFLRAGEQVQLTPDEPLAALASTLWGDAIYGVSRTGRPPGAEPVVTQEWSVAELLVATK